ncbi:MAG: hypothetical protein ACM3YM_05725 [Sphingomonadales bacterium]
MKSDTTVSVKLDWARLLGFEQVMERREAMRMERIAGKVGQKVGQKTGVKIGQKEGVKSR